MKDVVVKNSIVCDFCDKEFMLDDNRFQKDLLEAQESYLNAKNSLSTAIVNYLVSYLEFLRDTETLEIDENGVWKGDLYEKISGEGN